MLKISFMIAAFLFTTNVLFAAQEVKITTYYPAPEGDYKQLQTAQDTRLAIEGGGVTIGQTSSLAGDNELKVAGDMQVTEHAEFNGTLTVKDDMNIDGTLRARGGFIMQGRPAIMEAGAMWLEGDASEV